MDVITYALCKGNGGGGSGGGAFVLNMTIDHAAGEATLDKTWNEIFTASATRSISIVWHEDGAGERFTQYFRVDRVSDTNNMTGHPQYTVYARFELEDQNGSIAFIADSADSYPTATMG